jgi:hypothetical protein
MKHLLAIALGLIAIAFSSVPASALFTWIVEVKNDSPYNITLRSYERSYGWSIPANSGPWSVRDLPVPWAQSENDWTSGHHISIEWPGCHWTIWQANWSGRDRVHAHSPCVWPYPPGPDIDGYAYVDGERVLFIDRYGRPSLGTWHGLRHKKAPLAKKVRFKKAR